MPEALIDKIQLTAGRHRMFEVGQRVGVAVSGGADSVALLYALHELSPSLGIRLAVLHLNHGLRGEASDGDEKFVRSLAEALGWPFHGEVIDLRHHPDNLEQAGRDARRSFFARLRAENVVERVATGHTRSDQAETVLYRFLRGAASAGLRGILPVTAEGLVRPLLDCTRHEIQQYLASLGQAWREDASNGDLAFARNRIRHQLLPTIERDHSPAIVQILATSAEIAREEEDYWATEAATLGTRYFERREGGVIIEASVLTSVHVALARRLLRLAVSEVKGNLRGLDLVHIDRTLVLARSHEGHGRIQIPELDIFRSFEWMLIAPQRTGSREERDYRVPLAGLVPGQIAIPGSNAICLELLDQSEARERYTKKIGELDCDLLVEPLELRNWHPGDEFQKSGETKVKIKTLFQEARVPIWERQGWPLITCGGRIAWTRQFGAAANFRPTSRTRKILRVVENEIE